MRAQMTAVGRNTLRGARGSGLSLHPRGRVHGFRADSVLDGMRRSLRRYGVALFSVDPFETAEVSQRSRASAQSWQI
jgi:hypothetical protein